MLRRSRLGQHGPSAEGAKTTRGARHGIVVARHHARGWSRTSGESRVATKHRDTRSVLGAAERDHVLANVAAYNLAVLRATVRQDVLNKVVSELVAGN
jgi:hypothetical protein